MKTLTTISRGYDFLRNSEFNRGLVVTLATLENGAHIFGKLPRRNDKTRRLSVGFSTNKFSALIHWTGTASAYANEEMSTVEELKYVKRDAEALLSCISRHNGRKVSI